MVLLSKLAIPQADWVAYVHRCWDSCVLRFTHFFMRCSRRCPSLRHSYQTSKFVHCASKPHRIKRLGGSDQLWNFWVDIDIKKLWFFVCLFKWTAEEIVIIMKKVFFALTALIGFNISVSFGQQDVAQDRIFKGWFLSPHEFPWMVKLKVRNSHFKHR